MPHKNTPKCTIDYANKCDCRDDDNCGCTYPNNCSQGFDCPDDCHGCGNEAKTTITHHPITPLPHKDN